MGFYLRVCTHEVSAMFVSSSLSVAKLQQHANNLAMHCTDAANVLFLICRCSHVRHAKLANALTEFVLIVFSLGMRFPGPLQRPGLVRHLRGPGTHL